MLIGIINQSTLVTEDDTAKMTAAVRYQLADHFCRAWDRPPPDVTFYPDPAGVPPSAHGIALVDTINDQPKGVLGYHTEDAKGQWGVVAVKPELDNGGQVLTGDWSVSSVLSHEALELMGDPSCSFWGADGNGTMYCLEVCDPVEAPTYDFGGVSVSNFITPAWFDPQAPAGSKFDQLGLLPGPFTLLKGGYLVYVTAGQERQKFGDEFPEWRREMKKGTLARTQRRLAQLP